MAFVLCDWRVCQPLTRDKFFMQASSPLNRVIIDPVRGLIKWETRWLLEFQMCINTASALFVKEGSATRLEVRYQIPWLLLNVALQRMAITTHNQPSEPFQYTTACLTGKPPNSDRPSGWASLQPMFPGVKSSTIPPPLPLSECSAHRTNLLLPRQLRSSTPPSSTGPSNLPQPNHPLPPSPSRPSKPASSTSAQMFI